METREDTPLSLLSHLDGQQFGFDHIAVTVGKGNIAACRKFFTHFLDARVVYDPGTIGDAQTGMKTCVVAFGDVQLALMEGLGDGSQIDLYEDGGGLPILGRVQHVAIACRDVARFAYGLRQHGVRFITEDEDTNPLLLPDTAPDGGTIIQVFSYPLVGGLFFEFKQKVPLGNEGGAFAEFRDANVRGLWQHVDRLLFTHGRDGFFRLNIFGDECSLAESLTVRGISVS